MHRSLLIWHTLISIKQNDLLLSFLAFNSFHWTLWKSAGSIIRGKLSSANLPISSNSSLYGFFNFYSFRELTFPFPMPLLLTQPSHVGIPLFTRRPDTTELKAGISASQNLISDCSHITLQWCAGADLDILMGVNCACSYPALSLVMVC